VRIVKKKPIAQRITKLKEEPCSLRPIPFVQNYKVLAAKTLEPSLSRIAISIRVDSEIGIDFFKPAK
jgi:hypothetical protein